MATYRLCLRVHPYITHVPMSNGQVFNLPSGAILGEIFGRRGGDTTSNPGANHARRIRGNRGAECGGVWKRVSPPQSTSRLGGLSEGRELP